MIDLTSTETVRIHGDRLEYVFTGVPGLNPRTLLGTQIQLNGRRARVTGVDVHAIAAPVGHPFGLLVEWLEPAPGAV